MLLNLFGSCSNVCKNGQSSTCQTPAQVTCAHCQRSSESASAPHPFLLLSVVAEAPDRAAHYRVVFVAVNTLLRFFFSPADRSRCREGLTFWRVLTDSSTPAFLFRPAPLEARQDTAMWAAHYREVSESVNSPARFSFLRSGSFPIPSVGPRIVGKYRNSSTPLCAFCRFPLRLLFGRRCKGAHCAWQQTFWEEVSSS